MVTPPRVTPVLASAAEAAAIQRLDEALPEGDTAGTRLLVPNDVTLDIPASVYQILKQIVHELAQGNAVTLMPIQRELTTQEAAEVLNISRPALVRLLERGDIPFRIIGTHRRIKVQDVIRFKERRSRRRRELLDQMDREAQEMGLLDME